jgi:hypothetical protein
MLRETGPLPQDRTESPKSPGRAPAGSARRRFLTHGLSGSSIALLIAGTPVRTLAKAYCKYSGWNSMKNAKKAEGGLTLSNAPKTCSVKVEPPSYYYQQKNNSQGQNGNSQGQNGNSQGQNGNSQGNGGTSYSAVNWPTAPFNGVTIGSNTTFGSLFGSDPVGGMGSTKLLQVLSSYPTSVEAYMIAVAFASTQTGFSLSQTYVVDLWTNYGNSTNAAALLEFLQQLV